MNEVVKFIAGLGVPGLVLLVAMGVVGWSGAAAIAAGLALPGGPFCMIGNIALLGVLGYISQAITQFGLEEVYRQTLDQLKRQGKSKKKQVQSYLPPPAKVGRRHAIVNRPLSLECYR